MRDKNLFKTNKQKKIKQTQKIQTLEIADLNLNIDVSMLKKLIYKRPHFFITEWKLYGKEFSGNSRTNMHNSRPQAVNGWI